MAEILGVEIEDPPEGWTCLEAIVIIKALNEEGEETIFMRSSEGLWNVEAVGMLAATSAKFAAWVAETFDIED